MDSILLAASGLRKEYNVPVLVDFDFDLRAGEVHALVGSNGAGKSTFANILCGLTPASGGTLHLHGKPYRPTGRLHARAAGVSMVMQELNLLPTLTVAENLFFDSLPHRLGWIDRTKLRQKAGEALQRVDLTRVDPDTPAGRLGVGHQQLVEIAAALTRECKVLILDEPTAALTDTEIEALFRQIEQRKQEGVGIIYVSHRMEEIQTLADRVTVLRDGRHIVTFGRDPLDLSKVIEAMAGKAIAQSPHQADPATPGPTVLRADGLASPVLQDISFSLRQGEILGVAGLVGSGRSELLRALFGADPVEGGSLQLRGVPVRIESPEEAVRRGIGMVPEDRKSHGLLLSRPIPENATLASHDLFSCRGFLDTSRELEQARRQCESLEVKLDTFDQPVSELSGGNQQKVIMSRWLLRDADILLLDEPTRGIDVGAKARIYALLRQLTREGKAVLMVSSELPELMQVCHRIAVLSNGRLARIFEPDDYDEHRITEAAFRYY